MARFPNRFSRLLIVSLVVCLVIQFAQQSNAQTLTDDQKASVAFDARLDKLMSSELGRKIVELFLKSDPDLQQEMVPLRAFGAANLPRDLQFMQGGKLDIAFPLDFFLQLHYPNQHLAEAPFDYAGIFSEYEFKDGKQTMKVANATFHFPKEGTLEISTSPFSITRKSQTFSSDLNNAWKRVGNDNAIRMAIDLKGRRAKIRELFEQFMKIADTQRPPLPAMAKATIKGYFEVLEGVDSIVIGMDLETENFVTLTAYASDQEKADRFHEASLALVGLAQQGLKTITPENSDAQSAEFAKLFSGAMKLSQNGTEVQFVIARSS